MPEAQSEPEQDMFPAPDIDEPTSCPDGKCGCECNFCAKYNNGGMDHVTASAAAAFTFDNMPPEVKILFSGFVRSRTLSPFPICLIV